MAGIGGARSFLGQPRPPCEICGGDCDSGTVERETSTFINPRSAMVPSENPILAPHLIIDEELERVVYSVGDPMTDADALKYLGITREKVKKEKASAEPATKRAKAASKDRAKKLANDRAKKPAKNR